MYLSKISKPLQCGQQIRSPNRWDESVLWLACLSSFVVRVRDRKLDRALFEGGMPFLPDVEERGQAFPASQPYLRMSESALVAKTCNPSGRSPSTAT